MDIGDFFNQDPEKARTKEGGEEDALAPITDDDESDESVVRRDKRLSFCFVLRLQKLYTSSAPVPFALECYVLTQVSSFNRDLDC